MRKSIYYLILFCLIQCSTFAQQEQIDKLKEQLVKEKSDTGKIQLINNLSSILIDNSDTINAMNYLHQALDLSNKINDNYCIAITNSSLGLYYVRISDYATAEKYFQEALSSFSKGTSDKFKQGVAASLGNLATSATRKGDIKKSIELQLKALDILTSLKGNEKYEDIANIYGGIATLYANEGQFDKSAFYDKKLIDAMLAGGKMNLDVGTSYIYLADDFMGYNQIDSAKKYMSIAKKIADSLNIPALFARYYSFNSKIYFTEKNYTESLNNALKARAYALLARNITSQLVAHLTIARSYKELGQPAKALPYLKEELAIAEKIQSERELKIVLQELSIVESRLNHFKEAYDYLNRFTSINDSIQKKQEKIKLNDIESKYQNEKKELQISQLEKEKEIQKLTINEKNSYLFFLISTLFAITLIVILYYRNSQRKQQLDKQQIVQLKQERQLHAVSGIVQTQEEERSRIAKDLHDGLGSLLSGVKLSLSSLKGNQIINKENVALFNNSIVQLDNAITEMRRVAHNMMPEALLKFGMIETIKSLCATLNESNTIKVHFEHPNFDERLSSEYEIIVFRMIQELVNNSLKHAVCKSIIIQLSKNNNILYLNVEDDGKGFSVSDLKTNKGMGYNNLNNRVEYMKGQISIQSERDKGTSVFIEIPLV